jgi:hypothetical protein
MAEQQRTRVGHYERDETDVYIGRGPNGRDMLNTPVGKCGWLGNPHEFEDHGRRGSVERFRNVFEYRIKNDPEFRERIRQLAGKRLGGWCQSLQDDSPACHGEVIAEWADKLANND